MIPENLTRDLVYLIQILDGTSLSWAALRRPPRRTTSPLTRAVTSCHIVCPSVCPRAIHVSLCHTLLIFPSHRTRLLPLTLPIQLISSYYRVHAARRRVYARAHTPLLRVRVSVACGRGYVKFRSIHRNAFATLVCHWRRRCARLKKTSNVRNKHGVRYNRHLLLASLCVLLWFRLNTYSNRVQFNFFTWSSICKGLKPSR